MIVFIKLVKRASILHEKFFIYKDQLTNTNHTILITQYSPTKQYTKQYFTNNTNSPTKQYFRILNNFFITHRPTNTPPNKSTHSITNHTHSLNNQPNSLTWSIITITYENIFIYIKHTNHATPLYISTLDNLISTNVNQLLHTYIHTYIQSYTQPYIHTYIHTYTPIQSLTTHLLLTYYSLTTHLLNHLLNHSILYIHTIHITTIYHYISLYITIIYHYHISLLYIPYIHTYHTYIHITM